MSSFVLPCWGRETGERPTIYLRGGASVTSLVTPASRFAPFTSVCHLSKSGVVWTVGWLVAFRLPWAIHRGSVGECRGKRLTRDLSNATKPNETIHERVIYLCLSPLQIWGRLGGRLPPCRPFTVGSSVGSVGGSATERDGDRDCRERRNDSRCGTGVPFTLVCHLSKSGVVWTVGWLAVFRLRWGDRRVGPDEASGKEMDPEPFERDGTTRDWAQTCRLSLFVTSLNLGSLGPSVVSVHPLFRDGSDASSWTDLLGKRRTWNPSNATKPNETIHKHVIHPRSQPL